MRSKEKVKKRKLRYTDSKETAKERDSGFTPAYIRLPEGVKMFRWKKEGVYRMDIIPYEVTKGYGEPGGNPVRNAKEGVIHPERIVHVHSRIGPDEQTYVCLSKVYKEPCPICEAVSKLRSEPGGETRNKKLIDAIKVKDRQLMNVKILTRTDDDDDEEPVIQLFEGPFYFGLGELIDNQSEVADDDDDFKNYFYLEGGKTLKITTKQDSFAGRSFYKPIDVKFKARKEDYDLSILDDVVPLDEIIIKTEYDELKDLFEEGGSGKKKKRKGNDDDDDDDTPKKKKKVVAEDDDDDEEPPRRKKAKASDDDDDDDDEADDDDDADSDDDDDEPTAKSLGIKIGSTVKHKKHGVMKVVHISPDGTTIRLQDPDDDDADVIKAISPTEVKLVKKTKPKPEEDDDDDEPRTRKRKAKDDEDEDDDEEDEDEEEAPKKKKKKVKASSDDDEWDDEPSPVGKRSR